MEWYEVLVGVVGILGGGAGLIAIYHARSNKDTIDIGNMQEMLNEAHKMFDELKKEKNDQLLEFQTYKEETETRIGKLEERVSRSEERSRNMNIAILQGYRCHFPKTSEDCPVIKEYEKRNCDGCFLEKE